MLPHLSPPRQYVQDIVKLFLLEPRVASIPLVAFWGYVTWYALFWTLYRYIAVDEKIVTLP